MFNGRKLLIITKHKKEQVIAPVLERELGVTCFTGDGFDTDLLGTFSGEVERIDDPVTTARKKCFEGMAFYDCDLAVASEGSFGAHPTIFFASADDEILLLIDKKNNLEIKVRHIATDTNFNGAKIHSWAVLKKFAGQVMFPSHGLILRKEENDVSDLVKGITTWEDLKYHYDAYISKYGELFAETDMRALYNPTRMGVIEVTVNKLAAKVNSCCPECTVPGFGVTDIKFGLPCSRCGFPTKSVLSHRYDCQTCNHSVEKKYPHAKISEDPQFCDVCNP